MSATTSRRALPWVGLGLAVAAVILAVIPRTTALGAVLGVAALAVAIISLGRRDRPEAPTIASLVVAGVGLYLVMFVAVTGVIATLEPFRWASPHSHSEDEAAPDPIPSPARDVVLTMGEGGTPADPLTFGQSVRIGDSDGDVWEISVSPPIDVTEATEEKFGVESEIGNYFAIPVTITNVSAAEIDPFFEFDVSPSLDFANEAGAPRHSFSFPNAEGLPDLGDVGPLAPGESAEYFQTFEIDAASIPAQRVLVSVGGLQLHWAGTP